MIKETYASLLNRKILIPSQKSNYIAVDRDFWVVTVRSSIAKIAVDEAYYLARYPDVAQAIANGIIGSAAEHFCESGYFEHRMPYRIVVDEPWYLAQYPDIADALAAKAITSAQTHFEEVGFAEGRVPFPNFALRWRDDVDRPAA